MDEDSDVREANDLLQQESDDSSVSTDTSDSESSDSQYARLVNNGSCNIPLERTLAIIKPDAMDKATEIEDFIMKKGFMILQKRKLRLTPEQASDFYSDHYGKMFFPSLIANISSGPIIVLVISKHHAVSAWNEIIGHANPFKARDFQPQSLRAIHGKDHIRNAVHGSENHKAAEKEIGFLFSDSILEPIATEQSAKDYITKQCQPTLLMGLTALSKKKPVDPITWLAEWLIGHNPKKPSVNQS